MSPARDTAHYQYDSYTTGRKQDYGHHTLNEENGWVCFDWDRDDYTETMSMKKPLEGKGWKPFRVYWYPSVFEDFTELSEAEAFFKQKSEEPGGFAHLIEVDKQTGKEIKSIAKFHKDSQTLEQNQPIENSELRKEKAVNMNISEKIDEYLQQTKEFTTQVLGFADHMKKQNRAYAIIDKLKFMEGDYVWVLDPRTVHMSTLMFNIDKVYIAARAKFNEDGTDNRMELTAENQLEIKQEHITAILYGNPSNSYFSRNDNEKKWYYKTGYSGEWTDEELISAVSKEDLIRRWRKKYTDLRDAFFENHYKQKEQEKQRKIDEAKRVLEQAGVK